MCISMYTYRSTHTITVQTNHHNIIIHHLKMQVYTTNKTSGSIYIIKKHPQHVTPLNGVRCFFRSNEIPFSKKGSWLIFRWIPPRSPPRHLDHRASVLHIVQLARKLMGRDGMGPRGKLMQTPLFGCLFEICLLEKMHIMMWKEIGHIGDHSYCDGTSRSGWISRTIIIFTYKKKRSGFCSGGKIGGSLLSRTSAKGCAFCWGRW